FRLRFAVDRCPAIDRLDAIIAHGSKRPAGSSYYNRPMLQNRWVMLTVVFVVRTSMGFMFQGVASVAPLLVAEFGLSYGQIGLLMGLFLLPGVIIALPGGALGQRFGSEPIAAAGLVLMVAGGLVTAASGGFAVACVGRAVSGAGGILLNLFLVKMV